jgi:uncharacterized protein YndB with AHSA1/START domain
VAAATGNLTFRLERVMAATRPAVFQAHADPELLAQWWGPKGFTAPIVDVDLRAGGSYRIAMQPPDGEPFYLGGEFREVDPPTRLVYTFRYDDPDPDDRETTVTFALDDIGDSTRVVVEQGTFATRARLALHQAGWNDTLDRLDGFVTGEV